VVVVVLLEFEFIEPEPVVAEPLCPDVELLPLVPVD